MHSPLIFGLFGLASAAPKAISLNKRAACSAQEPGISGYSGSADTAQTFLSSPSWTSWANGAVDPTGYAKVFTNLSASNNAYDYRGHILMKSYDVAACAAQCTSKFDCMAFNILVERVPSLEPGPGCENPSGMAYIKCVWWGGPVGTDNAVNSGSTDYQFQRVIAGSNGYVKQGIELDPIFTARQYFGSAAIQAPAGHQVGSTIFQGPFDANKCAEACKAHTRWAADKPSEKACKFINTYYQIINNGDNIDGQFCVMYDQEFDGSYATNRGQTRGSDNYLIAASYGWLYEVPL